MYVCMYVCMYVWDARKLVEARRERVGGGGKSCILYLVSRFGSDTLQEWMEMGIGM